MRIGIERIGIELGDRLNLMTDSWQVLGKCCIQYVPQGTVRY